MALDFQEEEKLKRLAELIPDPDPEPPGQIERTRDELGRFAPEEKSTSKWEDVRWVPVDDHTFVRRRYPLWSDVLIIGVFVGLAALIF